MIDVLLATYRPNAEWLKQQIDSIRAQAGVEVNLICREDAGGLGARENFSALLGESKADYVAFADQDDIWRPDKLAKCLAKLQDLETRYGRETPLLVFCDGRVTDEELKPRSGTVISRQGVDVARGLTFSRLLMQNFIAGNAMLFNAALRKKAGSVPDGALMHDSWMGLVAAAFGHIGFVDEPLYLYRQHVANVAGETKSGIAHFAHRILQGPSAFRKRLRANVLQAHAFAERFGVESPAEAVALAGFSEGTPFGRRVRILRHRLYKQGFLRNLTLLILA